MALSKSERTKITILNAAAHVLSKQADATLNDIAIEAGVGRATLHRHFENREDLIRKLALKALSEVRRTYEEVLDESKTAEEGLEILITSVVPDGARYRFLATDPVCYTDPEVTAEYNTQLGNLAALVERLKEANLVSKETPTAWAVSTIDSLIYAAWFSVVDGYVARREAPHLAIRTILKGLG